MANKPGSSAPPVILVGLTAGAMWGLSLLPPDMFRPPSYGMRLWIGGVWIILGLIIDLICVRAFLKARTTVNPLNPVKASSIVRTGLYKYSRNPMYVGFVAILIGWGIILGSVWAIFPILAFIFYMTKYQIRPEEAAMIYNFGDDYRAYMSEVRRWI